MVSNYEFNRLGRIWVVWSTNVQLQVIFKSGQMIVCLVQVEHFEEEFICSFIYASNFVEERKMLWRDIQNLQNSVACRNKPWILFGDFNETLKMEEHSSSVVSPMVTPGMRDFQNVVRYCSLEDMRTHGPLFTWGNKRDDGLICKKLDRVLMNVEYTSSYPQSYCLMDSGGCSDHLWGRIFLKSAIQKPKGPFKFTNAIAAHPESISKVKDYWKETTVLFPSTSTLFRFSKKLKELKPILRELSRNSLSDLSRRATEAYEELCTCQTKSLSTLNPQDIYP